MSKMFLIATTVVVMLFSGVLMDPTPANAGHRVAVMRSKSRSVSIAEGHPRRTRTAQATIYARNTYAVSQSYGVTQTATTCCLCTEGAGCICPGCPCAFSQARTAPPPVN